MNKGYVGMFEDKEFAKYSRKDSRAKELKEQIRKYEKMIKEITSDINEEEDDSNRRGLYRILGIFHGLIEKKERKAMELEKEVGDYLKKENLSISEGGNNIKCYDMEENE